MTSIHSLDAKGSSPSLKKHYLSKLLEIKHNLDLCDIWRVIQIRYKDIQENLEIQEIQKGYNILLDSNIFLV